jgi:uncharacterized protein (TIGR03118 family)
MRISRPGTVSFLGLTLACVLGALTVAHAQSYKVTFLTADEAGKANNTDPNLINPWGISFSSTGPFWVSDNLTGLSTLYDTNGAPQPLVVTIPSHSGGTGSPTGTVFNSTSDFMVTKGGNSAPALFLFNTLDGTISGWASSVDSTHAIIAVDNATKGASYDGMEIANNGSGNFLYNANFPAGTVDVYDGHFNKAALAGSFVDPNLPAGYAPYNIRKIGNRLYVVFCKQNQAKNFPEFGAGLGVVSIFDLNGNFVKRFAAKGKLNAPWGIAKAPKNFGMFSGAILVGNLGDGRISAYDATTRKFLGQLKKKNGKAIVLEGLWALTFGNGGSGGAKNKLYFTSGPSFYTHGRFGSISAK